MHLARGVACGSSDVQTAKVEKPLVPTRQAGLQFCKYRHRVFLLHSEKKKST